jgi:hypothetical protein
MPTTKTKKLPLDQIVIDDDVLVRSKISEEHIEDLFEALKQSAKLPPIIVFDDNGVLILVDGHHRYEAAKKCKLDKIEAEIRKGTKREAILCACGTNEKHGLRRTNGDKRRAVIKVLSDLEWRGWTDGKIAKVCAVTQPFVLKLRQELRDNGYEFPSTRKGANGKIYHQRKKEGSDVTSSDNPDPEENISSESNEGMQTSDVAAEKEDSENITEAISEVGATIFNLQNEISQLSKMVQKNAKWSTDKKDKLRHINKKIDEYVHTIHDWMKKIINCD